MASRRSLTGALARRAIERIEEAAGQTVTVAGHALVPEEKLAVLEAGFDDYRSLQRELELIGFGLFDFANRQPNEIASHTRRRIVQRARVVWANDPQAGAAVELMNDFVFGRGVPRPRCKDTKVQAWVDEAWDDPDNQEVLTTFEAQLALGIDLAVQSNLFMLVFDEGADGKVKLSILRHDDVIGAVPDPEKRHRVCYYIAHQIRVDWDYTNDRPAQPDFSINDKPWYYEQWRNVELALNEEGRDQPFVPAPSNRVKPGKVYHVRINRGTEQIFGVPRFQRTLRWYSAYNDYVKDRLDIVKAAAAVIVKNKIKGTPDQVARDATMLISKASQLTAHIPPQGFTAGSLGAAGMWHENDTSTLAPFNMDTRAGNAQADAQIIRAPISAAERWTQAYMGDASNSNLASATSLELPILKMVEARQEVFEQLLRWFIDRVIEKGVESGSIPKLLDPGETEPDREPMTDQEIQSSLYETCEAEIAAGRVIQEVARVQGVREEMWLVVSSDGTGKISYTLVESYEDKGDDEAETQRNLGYEFKMPSPLRRMMTDLVTAVQLIATTFDPNNTNPNLSRILLTVALGEGLEVQDAPELVDQAIPKGYVDPLLKAQMASGGMDAMGRPLPQAQPPTAGFGPADSGQAFPGGSEGNPYSAPMNSTMPEDAPASGPYANQQAAVAEHALMARGRERAIEWPRPRLALAEAGVQDMDERARAQLSGRKRQLDDQYREDVLGPAMAALDDADLLAANEGGR